MILKRPGFVLFRANLNQFRINSDILADWQAELMLVGGITNDSIDLHPLSIEGSLLE